MTESTTGLSSTASSNPWVISVKDLLHSPGTMRTINDSWPAPEDLSVPLLGITPGDDLDVDVRLEAVHEGILVSGVVTGQLTGECSRCLDPIEETLGVDVQELFLFQPAEGMDEDQHLVVHDAVDLEPIVRDAVVISLPFQPVCRPDCEGLCSECGIRLEDAPEDHGHEQLDPRWSVLAEFAALAESTETRSDKKTSTHETEER